MIDQRTVTAATCDACGTVRYAEAGYVPGFTVTVSEYDGARYGDGDSVNLFVCRISHIGKAARLAFAALADQVNQERAEASAVLADHEQPALAGV